MTKIERVCKALECLEYELDLAQDKCDNQRQRTLARRIALLDRYSVKHFGQIVTL